LAELSSARVNSLFGCRTQNRNESQVDRVTDYLDTSIQPKGTTKWRHQLLENAAFARVAENPVQKNVLSAKALANVTNAAVPAMQADGPAARARNAPRASIEPGRASIVSRGDAMIVDAKSRVPDANHWDIFRKAEQSQPALIAELANEFRKHVASKPDFNSTAVGAAILGAWTRRDEFTRIFGSDAAQLFGMVAWTALFDDAAVWRSTSEAVGGRKVRVYRRAEPEHV